MSNTDPPVQDTVTPSEAVDALVADQPVPVSETTATQAQTQAELDAAEIQAKAAATALAPEDPMPGDAGGSDVTPKEAVPGDGTGPDVDPVTGDEAETFQPPPEIVDPPDTLVVPADKAPVDVDAVIVDDRPDEEKTPEEINPNFTGGHSQAAIVHTDDPRVKIVDGEAVVVGPQPDPTYDDQDGLIGPKAERGPLGSPPADAGEDVGVSAPAMEVPGHAEAAEQAVIDRHAAARTELAGVPTTVLIDELENRIAD